ncbi:Heat shock protein E [Serratia fonticola]|uniref:Heat shock protein E n=1 Tax=Serratia fonticola TaxID=47917 RepID=A0A0F7H8N5_SERFO|nr:fimbria/pilus outer membrane usher protein [Serratia fonticola]AKG68307.1 usher protein FimD [Serratia fonticola]CAI1531578.1 Heat shock protein E [Serratia fonticola]VTR51698.1 Heat shock protein E [Serratia fonticola]
MMMKNNITPLLAFVALALTNRALAIEFDTRLLAGASREADLSRFYRQSDLPPGLHTFDIYVNGTWKGRFPLLFGDDPHDITLRYRDATLLGIDLSALSGRPASQRISLNALLQGGTFQQETATLSLRLQVPQAYILHAEKGYVNPQLWQQGESALLLSYNTTYYHSRFKLGEQTARDDLYSGVNSGLNIGGWQFRDNSTFSHHSDRGSQWRNNTRYLQRSFSSFTSTLTGGDFYSPGNLFDSLRLRGIALASDLNMLPNSQQGFAPVVQGVAQTNALVKVLQGGNVIYQENVPPGAFTFNSIQPTGSGGDLVVVVKEADGSEQSFTVPFSSVPNMLKQGVSRYDVVAGKVKQSHTHYEPTFLQSSLQYGVNNLVTGYAGILFSDDYRAYLLGSGWNLPIGALSVDITQANTHLYGRNEKGQSYRIAYSKYLDTTATNFTLAAYRYSTRGYYSFTDALYAHDGYRQYSDDAAKASTAGDGLTPSLDMNTLDGLRSARPRNTFSLNLNQRLDDNLGTLFFSGTQRDYWNEPGHSREYQLGYSNALGPVDYNVSASRIRNTHHNEETRYYMSVAIPFDAFGKSAYLSSSLAMTDRRYQQSQLSISGVSGDANQLSYTLSGANQPGGNNMASVNTQYRTPLSTLGGSYSEATSYRQAGLSARGSVVAIPGHLLAANETGHTLTIIDAPQASGLMVNGDSSILTNKQGLALVPYATPYRQNSLTLSDTPESSGAEIINNIGYTVPFRGAVNRVIFATDQRQSYTLKATFPDGSPLPFGAEVVDHAGEPVGYIGQSSILHIKMAQPPSSLTVKLNKRDTKECVITVTSAVFTPSTSLCH